MIPASYLFKDTYRSHWGDPANPHAEPVETTLPARRTPWFGASLTSAVAALAHRAARQPRAPQDAECYGAC